MKRTSRPHMKGTQSCTQPGTQDKIRRRKRPLPDIYAENDRLHQKFMKILNECDPRVTVYVYRAQDSYAVPPYLLKCCPYWNLEGDIIKGYGSGEYALYIRRGETMILSGIITVEAPLNWRKP